MASSSRCYLLTICIMQLVVTIQRQVFDFLGYMWAPIIGNFFHIIAVILGFFGGYHCRPKYLTVYSVWMWIWLGWNIFTICFYLEVGTLSRDSDILNIGTESRSWWEVNGIGCQPMYNFTHTTEDHVLFSKPISIEGCLLEYYYVECIQAGVQCLLAVLGFIGAVATLTLCTEEDDTFTVKPSTGLPYSIEYQVQNTESLLYDKPMMPRKMKRHSTRSKNEPYQPGYYQNPIRSILDRPLDTSSNDSCGIFYSGQPNPAYTKSGSRPSSARNLLRPESLLPNDRPRHSYPNQSETNI